MIEKTLIILKPDAMQRGLCGVIICRLEVRQLAIVQSRVLTMSEELAEAHYAEHVGKPFYDRLVEHMTSGPVMALAVQGKDVIRICRNMIGAAFDAPSGTIRGDFAGQGPSNLVHGSDSKASAERELALFFPEGKT